MKDSIHIAKLRVRCHIGATARERRRKQRIILDLTLYCDLNGNRIKDDLSNTVDYSLMVKDVIREAEASRFSLIESLAELIAQVCLSHPAVLRVKVRVRKPGALQAAAGVSVVLMRSR